MPDQSKSHITKLLGIAMIYPDDTEMNDIDELPPEYRLLLDGTANLEDGEDDSVPRLRGLIELLQDYLGD
jgi:hypothetical protein